MEHPQQRSLQDYRNHPSVKKNSSSARPAAMISRASVLGRGRRHPFHPIGVSTPGLQIQSDRWKRIQEHFSGSGARPRQEEVAVPWKPKKGFFISVLWVALYCFNVCCQAPQGLWRHHERQEAGAQCKV